MKIPLFDNSFFFKIESHQQENRQVSSLLKKLDFFTKIKENKIRFIKLAYKQIFSWLVTVKKKRNKSSEILKNNN